MGSPPASPSPSETIRTVSYTHLLEKEGLADKMEQAHFMPWGTGGSMVPPEVMEEYYRKGKE